MPSRSRCSKPQETACFTAVYTLSHPTWNASATSFHDIRFAQRARNHWYSRVIGLLPSAQGTRSTFTPQLGQFTRRMQYTKYTGIIHNGTNSNRRGSGD